MNHNFNKKIKLLYYSNALIANHGGRKHSEAFLLEAAKNPMVEKVISYPKPKSGVNSFSGKKNYLKGLLKKSALFQILSFYLINYKSYKEIIPVIEANDINTLHIRVTANFLIIEKLKKIFPDLIITTEVNASPFDEIFQKIIFKKKFEALERRSLEKADANFFVSDFLRKRIMGDINEKRDYVVQNGVNLELFPSQKEKKEEGIFTFGYVGTIDFHKELKVLIDAYEKVRYESNKETNLMIIGDGPMMQNLTSYIEQKGLTKNVELTGWVEHSEIIKYLRKMDVAIHHSANQYMSPLKIFEYLAVGLPVIGPNIPALREILVDKEEIFLVNLDADEIYKKMVYLMEHEEERERISRKGQAKVRANFSWKKNVDSILSLMHSKI